MFVAAGDEYDADHEAQEKKRDVGEASQFREGHASYSEAPAYSRRASAAPGCCRGLAARWCLEFCFLENVGANDSADVVVILRVPFENGLDLLGQRAFLEPFLLLVRIQREHERLGLLQQKV
jgi:hypothetical protein